MDESRTLRVQKPSRNGRAGVKIARLPGLEEHGDVYDYLQSHAAQDLLAEINQAPQWRPASVAREFFVGAMRFANTVPDEIEWAVKPITPSGCNGFVIADPKSLKSYSILDLLISLSLGLNWLGFKSHAACARPFWRVRTPTV